MDGTQSPDEIIGAVGKTVLKRSDFMSLGLNQEVEATVSGYITQLCFNIFEVTCDLFFTNISDPYATGDELLPFSVITHCWREGIMGVIDKPALYKLIMMVIT